MGKKQVPPTPPVPEYATKAELEMISEGMVSIVSAIKTLEGIIRTPPPVSAVATNQVVAETPLEKEVRKAGPDVQAVSPEWEEKAREIIGDAVDHCEIQYLRRGGTIFTVVIKPEFSNAPREYLDTMKADRRSKEIGNEGIEGVEQWCKLIKQNLSRPKY